MENGGKRGWGGRGGTTSLIRVSCKGRKHAPSPLGVRQQAPGIGTHEHAHEHNRRQRRLLPRLQPPLRCRRGANEGQEEELHGLCGPRQGGVPQQQPLEAPKSAADVKKRRKSKNACLSHTCTIPRREGCCSSMAYADHARAVYPNSSHWNRPNLRVRISSKE